MSYLQHDKNKAPSDTIKSLGTLSSISEHSGGSNQETTKQKWDIKVGTFEDHVNTIQKVSVQNLSHQAITKNLKSPRLSSFKPNDKQELKVAFGSNKLINLEISKLNLSKSPLLQPGRKGSINQSSFRSRNVSSPERSKSKFMPNQKFTLQSQKDPDFVSSKILSSTLDQAKLNSDLHIDFKLSKELKRSVVGSNRKSKLESMCMTNIFNFWLQVLNFH